VKRSLLDADRSLFFLVHGRMRSDWIDPVMVWLTKAGTKGVLWLGIAAGLLIESTAHGRWIAILSSIALLTAEGIINLVLKPVIARERPYERLGPTSLLVGPPGHHSWPSAHAGSSMAAAVVLASGYRGWGLMFLCIALLIGYSRVYVGVHYPFDVLAGASIGALCAAGVLLLAAALGPILHAP